VIYAEPAKFMGKLGKKAFELNYYIYVRLCGIASESCLCVSLICRIIVALFTVLENFADVVIGW